MLEMSTSDGNVARICAPVNRSFNINCGCRISENHEAQKHDINGPAVNADNCCQGHKHQFFIHGREFKKEDFDRIVELCTEFLNGSIAGMLANCYIFACFERSSYLRMAKLEERWKKLGGGFDEQTNASLNLLLTKNNFIQRPHFSQTLNNSNWTIQNKGNNK